MSIAKTFGTLSLTAMGLINAADATAQDTKTASKPEPNKVVKFITNENNENEATLVSKSTNAELAGRARVEAANSNKITQQDTPLAETVEAIAAEVSEYGLLQTRQEKLDFAKRVLAGTEKNLDEGQANAGSEASRFLKGIKWINDSKQNSLFDTENGFTKERLVKALINSPIYEESMGSILALARGKTTVPFITTFNEKLIREGKITLNSESHIKEFASIKR